MSSLAHINKHNFYTNSIFTIESSFIKIYVKREESKEKGEYTHIGCRRCRARQGPVEIAVGGESLMDLLLLWACADLQ